LFRLTDKYGLTMAGFLPALLLCSRWSMEAEVWSKDRQRRWTVTMDSAEGRLRSHYTDPARYDSLLEQRFAERFEALDTPWQLERETEIVNLLDTVMIPDFAFRHPDGRRAHLEIVGYWRRDYLTRKLDKLRRARRHDLIVAVSSHLQVDRETWAELAGPVVTFKGSLEPRDVLRQLDALAPAGTTSGGGTEDAAPTSAR
jgi:predicted nuclease of restriction endonuclease-like RecB superfamily